MKGKKKASWRRRMQICSQALFYLARLQQDGATSDDLGMLHARLLTQQALLKSMISENLDFIKEARVRESRPPQ